MKIETLIVDYLNKDQRKDIIFLLDCYANDLMGGSMPLSEETKVNLIDKLSKISTAFSIICYIDDKPAGLVNCFEGFSTFQCKPLINVHDLFVFSAFRSLGISQLMLAKVEEIAQSKDCCKITLEVLEGNFVAQKAYLKYGFKGYQLNPSMGKALFWQKNIT